MLYQECSSYLPPVATGYTLCRCPGASFRIFLATTLKGEASTPYNWVFWGETLQGKWDIPPWEKENHLQKSLGNRIFVSSQQFQQRSWFFWGRHIGISDIFIRPSTPSFFGCYYYQPSKCTYKRCFSKKLAVNIRHTFLSCWLLVYLFGTGNFMLVQFVLFKCCPYPHTSMDTFFWLPPAARSCWRSSK